MRNAEKGVTAIAELEVGGAQNQTDTGIPAECLSDMFEAQVDRTPERTAFVFGNSRLTYAELDSAGNRFARYLVARGIGPECIVALVLPRSLNLLIALIGVVKAGAAYLPLDPQLPSARLRYMLEDSGSSLVITTGVVQKGLQLPSDVQTIVIDDIGITQELATFPGHRVTNNDRSQLLQPGNLLYTIYTSGSTGKPKGVAVEHRNFTIFLKAMLSRVAMEPEERLLAITTISFDIAGLELFLPLLQGASLEMLDDTVSRDPVQVVAAVVRSKANVVQATPTFWRALLSCNMPHTVRCVLIGGEPLPADLVPKLLAFSTAINLYGPTETTVWSSCHLLVPEDINGGPVVSVGRPLDQQEFYILDENRTIVPMGSSGELYIAGSGVARGYLHRPELTAERFLTCPFGRPGRRMYRTGDLAQWRENGEITFLGRADQQVKIRGFRVEPGEIETALLRLVPSIKECVVVAREIRGQMQLVAYHVNVPGSHVPNAGEIRTLLAECLPDYMVPSVFVRLDRMPLTPNAKLDRKALPQPEEIANQFSFRPPVGTVESVICEVFGEMTGAPSVGRDDDFFQIGGNSLAAVLCIHRLRRELNQEVTLRQLLGAPTPLALARSLSGAGTDRSVRLKPTRLAYPTIFLLPGRGGDEPRLVRFRMEWEGVARIVPLEYPDWTELLDREGGMETLVHHFLRRIEEELSDGPVWLLGYSMGGNCAHAIALHLVEAGRQVAFLGLLDSAATPSSSEALSAQLHDGATPLQEVWHVAKDMVRIVRAIPKKAVTQVFALTIVRRLTSPWARPALALAARYRHVQLPLRFGYHLHFYLNEARRVAAVKSWHRAISEAPVPLAIRVFLFRSESHLPGEPIDLGWERHFPLVEVLDLPGTHETMFEPPHLRTLSERTLEVIDGLRGTTVTQTSAIS